MTLSDLQTPCTLLDLDVMEQNIARFQALANAQGVKMWPMTKTHKSTRIAALQMRAGASGFLVGTPAEVQALARMGAPLVCYAYPLASQPNLAAVLRAAGSTRLVLSVDSATSAQMLNDACLALGIRAQVLLLIDSGLQRFGVPPARLGALARDIQALPQLKIVGIGTHPGQVYGCSTPQQVTAAAQQEADAIEEALHSLGSADRSALLVASGSTPTFSLSVKNPRIGVQRPGNYVFFDRVQYTLGACTTKDCALTIMATVVSNPEPGRYVIDAGSKHLGLDKGAHGNTAIEGFGCVLGHPEVLVHSLSEEVGILLEKAPPTLAIGDTLRIIPNHACTAAYLASAYVGIRGGKVAEIIYPDMKATVESEEPIDHAR